MFLVSILTPANAAARMAFWNAPLTRQEWTRLLVVCVAALLSGMCDSAGPAAPTGTVLMLAANPTTVTVDQTSELTVTGSGPFGNPLTPGTQLRLSTTLGRLSAEVLTADRQGRATATLTPAGQTGTATVTVVFDGGRSPQSASVQVTIMALLTPPVFTKDFAPATITAGALTASDERSKGRPAEHRVCWSRIPS